MVKHQISPLQHGFFPGRSTVTNLVTTLEVIAKNMDMQTQTDVIYTDFEKAFDCIDHDLLIAKLSRMGIPDNLVIFLSSYLYGRKLYVFYKGIKSPNFCATSGVPQGANLATLLFLIFINDIAVDLGDEIVLFADDLKLFHSIQQLNDTSTLQAKLIKLSNWCSKNRISLNIEKCAVLSFSRSTTPILTNYTINGRPLSRVTSFKDLGVTFHATLSFRQHYSIISTAASRAAGFIMRHCKKFSNLETLKMIYFLVGSIEVRI